MKTACFALVAALLLAGCASDEAPDTGVETPAGDEMTIRGSVMTPEIAPIGGANVTLRDQNLTVTTDDDGSFTFPAQPLGAYVIIAEAAGYVPAQSTIPPGHNESLLFTLEEIIDTPTIDVQRYNGHLQCGAEYLIIAGSCDRISTEVGGPPLTSSEGVFEHHMPADWTTVVVDVVFDSAAADTYDGLRVTVKGVNDADALNEYAQYGRFHDSTSYTFRIEPGETYPDGVAAVPGNTTALLFDVFAQGHGYHQVCDPTGNSPCFLGVGAGVNIQFELVITTFTLLPAPAGFTQN